MWITENEYYINDYSKLIENRKTSLAYLEKEAMAILHKGNVEGLTAIYNDMESDRCDIKYFRKLKMHLIKLGRQNKCKDLY